MNAPTDNTNNKDYTNCGRPMSANTDNTNCRGAKWAPAKIIIIFKYHVLRIYIVNCTCMYDKKHDQIYSFR